MTDFCHIVPTAFLDKWSLGYDQQLLLAHLVEEDANVIGADRARCTQIGQGALLELAAHEIVAVDEVAQMTFMVACDPYGILAETRTDFRDEPGHDGAVLDAAVEGISDEHVEGIVTQFLGERRAILEGGFEDALQVCRDHPNTYMGTTLLRFHKLWANNPEETIVGGVTQSVEELGAERVVFGSNLPEYRPIQVKRAIQRLNLGAEAEELIFGGNLARIYGLS